MNISEQVSVSAVYKHAASPHLSTNFVFSVFPAPDSPETMMDWLIFSTFMSLYALSAARGTQTEAAVRFQTVSSLEDTNVPNNWADTPSVWAMTETSDMFRGCGKSERSQLPSEHIRNYNIADYWRTAETTVFKKQIVYTTGFKRLYFGTTASWNFVVLLTIRKWTVLKTDNSAGLLVCLLQDWAINRFYPLMWICG